MRHTKFICNICNTQYESLFDVSSVMITSFPLTTAELDSEVDGVEVLDICAKCLDKLSLPFDDDFMLLKNLQEKLVSALKWELKYPINTDDEESPKIKLDLDATTIDNSVVDGAKADPKWGQPTPIEGLNNDVIEGK